MFKRCTRLVAQVGICVEVRVGGDSLTDGNYGSNVDLYLEERTMKDLFGVAGVKLN